MRPLLLFVFCMLFTFNLHAQSPTKFMGIPIDGSKEEMITKLKAKGFTSHPLDTGKLQGEFNGTDVNILIQTNNNKVSRIIVYDQNTTTDERSIQIRFNNLIYQFRHNDKYLTFEDATIPDDENISYEMNVNHKRYSAIFCQKPVDTSELIVADTTNYWVNKFKTELLKEYTEEQIQNMTEDEMKKRGVDFAFDLLSKYPVWFLIHESYGQYRICLYYENGYNTADGSDL